MNEHDYSFCFLRYRQDPEAGEFANVGIALWSPESRFLGFQGSRRFSRLTHFFGDLDRDGYRLLLAHVERRFDTLAEQLAGDLVLERLPANAREISLQVVPEDDGSLLWSPVRGGLTMDPSAELSRLFDRFIGRLNEPQEMARRKDSQVFREVYRRAFTSEEVASRLEEKEVVAPLAAHTFKYAWKNGVWNVYETLSFDFADAESIERKAHAWFGRSVHLAQSPEPLKINFLLGKPTLEANRRAYAHAKDILRSERHVTLIEEEEAADFGESLRGQLLQAVPARSV